MAKQGCDNNCATCNSANHAYCALLIAKSNQQILIDMQANMQGVSDVQLITPKQDGEREDPEDNN
jgi:hypothetical protein